MSTNMPVGSSTLASDYGDYGNYGEQGNEGNADCCCEHPLQNGGGYQVPVESREGGSQGGGEGDGEAVWMIDPNTGYVIPVPVARGGGGQGGGSGEGGGTPVPPMPDLGAGTPLVMDGNGNVFVRAIDGGLYPIDMPGGDDASQISTQGPGDGLAPDEGAVGESDGGTASADTSTADAEVEPDPMTGLVTEIGGERVPLTPELAEELGGEQVRTLIENGQFPDAARAEEILADPMSLATIGVVLQTARDVAVDLGHENPEGFAERAVQVLITDVGTSAGNADELISRMMSEGLNGSAGGIGIEQFVMLANDGEFLGELLSMLPEDESGSVPPESVDAARAFVQQKLDPDAAPIEPSAGAGGDEATGETAQTQTQTQTTSSAATQGADDATLGSGDPLVDEYLSLAVGEGFLTTEEARTIAGDAGVVAALQTHLRPDADGRPTDPQRGAYQLLVQLKEELSGDAGATSAAAPENAGGEGTSATGNVAQSGGAAPDIDAEVDDFLGRLNPIMREELLAHGLPAEVIDQVLGELAGDEGFRAELAAKLLPEGQTQVTEANAIAARDLTVERVGQRLETRAEELAEERGAATGQSAEEIEQQRDQIAQTGAQIVAGPADFLGLDAGQGAALAGGGFDVVTGLNNQDYELFGDGLDEIFTDGAGLNTEGTFGHIGGAYESGSVVFSEDASLLERGVAGVQLVGEVNAIGQNLGFWGGDDDEGGLQLPDDPIDLDIDTSFDDSYGVDDLDFSTAEPSEEHAGWSDTDSLSTDLSIDDGGFDSDSVIDTGIDVEAFESDDIAFGGDDYGEISVGTEEFELV